MKSFAQSSLVEVPFEKVFDYLHIPAHNVGLDSKRPTLHVYVPHGLAEGQEIKYNLFYGLINISWRSNGNSKCVSSATLQDKTFPRRRTRQLIMKLALRRCSTKARFRKSKKQNLNKGDRRRPPRC